MRSIFVGVLAALVLLSVVAWRTQPDVSRDPRIVLLWATDDNPTREAQLELFNRQDKQYRVMIDPANAGFEKVIVQSIAGVGPDLIDTSSVGLGAYVKSGVAMDLTAVLALRGSTSNEIASRGALVRRFTKGVPTEYRPTPRLMRCGFIAISWPTRASRRPGDPGGGRTLPILPRG